MKKNSVRPLFVSLLMFGVIGISLFSFSSTARSMEPTPNSQYLPAILRLPTITPTPPPTPTVPPGTVIDGTVVILPNSHVFKTSGDYVILMGEVENRTDRVISSIQIAANLFDDQDRLTGTSYTYAYLTYLRPGEKTCFRIGYPSNVKTWARHEFEKIVYREENRLLRSLSVSNHSGSVDDWNSYHIIGLVRNDSAFKVNRAHAVGTLYNRDQNVIGCDYDLVNSYDLDPGQVSGFDIEYWSVNSTNVTNYHIQASYD